MFNEATPKKGISTIEILSKLAMLLPSVFLQRLTVVAAAVPDLSWTYMDHVHVDKLQQAFVHKRCPL